MSGPVLLFALGVSIATGLIFGIAPVVHRRAHDLITALKEGGSRGVSSGGRLQIRRALVTAEVALAVMLVIGAALLIRTVYNLNSVDAGFDRSRLVSFSVTFAEPYDPDTRALAYQRFLDKLRATPGIEAVTFMAGLPPSRPPEAIRTGIEGYKGIDDRPVAVIDYYQFVLGNYFATMGVPIVEGRAFEPTDTVSSGKVVVVNETMAKRIWPGKSPIGQRVVVNYGAFGFANADWHTVVGVAKDVKQGGVDNDTGAELFVAMEQFGLAAPTMHAVLRTALPAATLSGMVERLVREVDPAVPIVRLREMETVFAETIRQPRLLAQLLGVFAALALLLAAVGTYGVFSYMVAQRRREIGIRLALGASRSSVLSSVMKQGLALALGGVVIGLAGAVVLNSLIASLLFGVESTDTSTFVAAVVTIMLAAALACWLPAWRASRLDPSEVLRHE